MATSTEKVLDFIEQLSDQPDADLEQFIPGLPVMMIRPLLAGAASRVPQDPDELDAWALRAVTFLLGMRSDDAEPVELMSAGDLAELGAAPPVPIEIEAGES